MKMKMTKKLTKMYTDFVKTYAEELIQEMIEYAAEQWDDMFYDTCSNAGIPYEEYCDYSISDTQEFKFAVEDFLNDWCKECKSEMLSTASEFTEEYIEDIKRTEFDEDDYFEKLESKLDSQYKNFENDPGDWYDGDYDAAAKEVLGKTIDEWAEEFAEDEDEEFTEDEDEE
jgi:hypothetical protein